MVVNGSNGRYLPDGDDPTAEALMEADDESLLALGSAVLAELKDRGMLHVLLRNRSDADTVFAAEEIRSGDGALEVVAEGFHAETPDRYELWVHEADALHADLSRPGLSETEAEALLGAASDEALLIELDRAQEIEAGKPPGGDAAEGEGIGPRIAIELLRRGVIEDIGGP